MIAGEAGGVQQDSWVRTRTVFLLSGSTGLVSIAFRSGTTTKESSLSLRPWKRCGSEERKAEQAVEQQTQLDAYITKADNWGEEIYARIPQDEVKNAIRGDGGVSKANGSYAEWPKYYVWDKLVTLKSDAPRTPTRLADDLEPWLESQGWVRNQNREMPPGKESFTRYYARDHYTLMVEVYTWVPPKAQNIFFTIVTPDTKPTP